MSQYRKPPGRDIHGVLILDKPAGMSSNQALQTVKRLLRANKAGHTGALDPAATGVLPLCFGEATKFSSFLLDSDKTYDCEILFGERRDTGDAEGEVVARCSAASITADAVRDSLTKFVGDIEQVPPMYSALKHGGQPLYKLARRGENIVRAPRPVRIHSLKLQAFRAGERASATVTVSCSKGTYIRSLAEDIGVDLGVGAHVCQLRRSAAGPFRLAQAHSLDDLQALAEQGPEQLSGPLLPVDSAIEHLPALSVAAAEARKLLQGQKITADQSVREGLVRVKLGDLFLGIAVNDGHQLAPQRLLSNVDIPAP